MNSLAWIEPALVAEGFKVPTELRAMIERSKWDQPPLFFLDAQEALAETEEMHRQFPSHHVIAFARRGDNDGVICIVLADKSYPKGHVLVLHDRGMPGYEIDNEFPSLAAWAKSAEEEIAERVSMGWDEPS